MRRSGDYFTHPAMAGGMTKWILSECGIATGVVRFRTGGEHRTPIAEGIARDGSQSVLGEGEQNVGVPDAVQPECFVQDTVTRAFIELRRVHAKQHPRQVARHRVFF